MANKETYTQTFKKGSEPVDLDKIVRLWLKDQIVSAHAIKIGELENGNCFIEMRIETKPQKEGAGK